MRRLPAWVRYFISKPRPPLIPGGVRGPYDPHKLTRDELLLMASLKAITPQHAERVIKRTGRRAAVLALERRPVRSKWRYKLKMLVWRIMGYVAIRRHHDGHLPRLKVRRLFEEEN
jgi:hypothetical protein